MVSNLFSLESSIAARPFLACCRVLAGRQYIQFLVKRFMSNTAFHVGQRHKTNGRPARCSKCYGRRIYFHYFRVEPTQMSWSISPEGLIDPGWMYRPQAEPLFFFCNTSSRISGSKFILNYIFSIYEALLMYRNTTVILTYLWKDGQLF